MQIALECLNKYKKLAREIGGSMRKNAKNYLKMASVALRQ